MGYSLLHYACSCGNFEIFEFLVHNVSNLTNNLIDRENPTFETPLHWAAQKNHYKICEAIVAELRALVREQTSSPANKEGQEDRGAAARELGMLELKN